MPLSRLRNRPISERNRAARRRLPQARPRPVFGPDDEICPQRIPLHIANHGLEVDLGLDGEGSVSSLVQMPLADFLVRLLPSLYVQIRDVLHERRQIAVVLGPQHHVPVVRHHAIPADSHRAGPQGLRHNGDELRIVSCRLKNGPSPHGAVQHVERQSSGRESSWAWHEHMYTQSPGPRQLAQIWWLAPFKAFAGEREFATLICPRGGRCRARTKSGLRPIFARIP